MCCLLLWEWTLYLLQPATKVLIENMCRGGPRTHSSRALLKKDFLVELKLHADEVLCPSLVFINPKFPHESVQRDGMECSAEVRTDCLQCLPLICQSHYPVMKGNWIVLMRFVLNRSMLAAFYHVYYPVGAFKLTLKRFFLVSLSEH